MKEEYMEKKTKGWKIIDGRKNKKVGGKGEKGGLFEFDLIKN